MNRRSESPSFSNITSLDSLIPPGLSLSIPFSSTPYHTSCRSLSSVFENLNPLWQLSRFRIFEGSQCLMYVIGGIPRRDGILSQNCQRFSNSGFQPSRSPYAQKVSLSFPMCLSFFSPSSFLPKPLHISPLFFFYHAAQMPSRFDDPKRRSTPGKQSGDWQSKFSKIASAEAAHVLAHIPTKWFGGLCLCLRDLEKYASILCTNMRVNFNFILRKITRY